ncbi:MAG: Gfo/Idh/MocA family oxidoreductase [Deltaproteobacteria bacterium]|nr:Gfo/Idh/MocA family oxidoreductase [Deltaproteobacteria bacterium]
MQATNQVINIVLQGLGAAGRARLEAIKQNPHFKLSGILSRRPELSTLSQTEALKDPQVQAIAISTENTHHAMATHQALEANKHVLCDYPIAIHAQEALALFKLAQKKQKILHIEHISLLSQEHLSLKEQAKKAGLLKKGDYLFTGGFNEKIANQSITGPLAILALPRLLQLADLWGDFEIEKSDYSQNKQGFSLHLHLKFKQGGFLGFTEERKIGLARKRSLLAKCENTNISWKSGLNRGGLFAKDLEYFYQRITQKLPCYYQETLMLKVLEKLNQCFNF